IEPHVWTGRLADEEAREIRRIKARIERERIPHGEDPQFHLKLGRGSLSDIEFTAQLLQLQHGVRATGTMDALVRLEQAGPSAPRRPPGSKASTACGGLLDVPTGEGLLRRPACRSDSQGRLLRRLAVRKGSGGLGAPTAPRQAKGSFVALLGRVV